MASDSGMVSRIDAVVDAALAEKRLVGGVVLVADDGETVYARAAGHADREAGAPVTLYTIFRFASLTKPIVSAATMALVEDGVIGIDDPVTRYLPDFRPKLPDGTEPVITIRPPMISPRCWRSDPPVNPGTPPAGGGCSTRSAVGRVPSSTSRAAP